MLTTSTRSWLRFTGYMTVVCGLYTMILGLVLWFQTLRSRKNLSAVWNTLPATSQSLLQQEFSCCGYQNSTSPPFVVDSTCPDALVAASTAFFGFGTSAVAQTVSDGDSYQQGYAAGAAAKERNSFNAFDSGYRAGQRDQSSADSQVASLQAYHNGYQAGLAQAESATTQAYNQGYENRAAQERIASARAFDEGFHAGAARQAARDDAEYP